jgi:hypothetical protein
MVGKPMEVIAPGTEVTIWKSVEAIVTGVLIEASGIRYRIEYWAGSVLTETFVPAGMVTTKNGAKLQQLGFVTEGW